MRVVYATQAQVDFESIEDYIAENGAPVSAVRFVAAIANFCESLATFPSSGVARDDLLPGLRLAHFRKRVVVAYRVVGQDLVILAAFYGGQDYEALLRDHDD